MFDFQDFTRFVDAPEQLEFYSLISTLPRRTLVFKYWVCLPVAMMGGQTVLPVLESKQMQRRPHAGQVLSKALRVSLHRAHTVNAHTL